MPGSLQHIFGSPSAVAVVDTRFAQSPGHPRRIPNLKPLFCLAVVLWRSYPIPLLVRAVQNVFSGLYSGMALRAGDYEPTGSQPPAVCSYWAKSVD